MHVYAATVASEAVKFHDGDDDDDDEYIRSIFIFIYYIHKCVEYVVV